MSERGLELEKLEVKDKEFVRVFVERKLIPAVQRARVSQEQFSELWEEYRRINTQYKGPAAINHVRDEIIRRVQKDLAASRNSFLEYTGTELTSDWRAYINLFELALVSDENSA